MLFYPSFTITFSSQPGFDRSMSHRIWATFWQISLLSRKKIWFFKILHFMGILLRSLPRFVLMVLRATSWNSVQLLVCFCPPLCQRFWCQVFFHIYCSRYIAIYIYVEICLQWHTNNDDIGHDLVMSVLSVLSAAFHFQLWRKKA